MTPSTRQQSNVTSGAWREVMLRECADLTLSSVDKKSKPNERPVMLCNYTDVYKNSFIQSGLDFMEATATEREIARCSLFTNDVIITKDSEKYDDIGVPALVREDIPNLVCGYHLAILRPLSKEVYGAYLFYALNTIGIQHQFHSRANGVTRFGLRKADIESVVIPLPPLAEQRRIAEILGTLDDKIELNRRMNETLDEMARAMFKDWFVDFGPVRAKMEGRDQYLPDDIWRLFPDRLADSELGEIPEEWEVERLGDCFDLKMGQSPPSRTYNDDGEGLPFFQGKSDFGFRYPDNRKYCSAPNRIAESGDTLVSVRAPVGDINMAWERCCVGRGLAALRHESGSRSFTYYSTWTLQHELRRYEHTGTVFGAINKKQFEELLVINPKRNIVNAFESLSRALDDRIESNVAESRTLAAMRDTLLPKLVSGEVRVSVDE